MPATSYIRWFRDIRLADVALVGGKNASLGELYGELTRAGVRVPDGFAITAEAYRDLIEGRGIDRMLADVLAAVDGQDVHALATAGEEARRLIREAPHPKDVIVRLSDFKSNEYAGLVGGRDFEPDEENPMLRFRGAFRYAHPRYREEFALECRAMRRVREELGLENVKLMIPFCRTPEEGRCALDAMAQHGLRRGERGLEVYVMCEIPSNIVLAGEFAALFDGFSIGSNDLTQLVLGVDRDSELVAPIFDERNPAVLAMLDELLARAHAAGTKVGICGQAPSDYPDFTRFLVHRGITSISLNPDALARGLETVAAAERETPARGEARAGRGRWRHVMTTQTFYRDVMSTSGERRRELAKRATAAVFHALRDRITPDEADQLQAQLPMELKEVWAEGEAVERAPIKMDRRAFLDRVRTEARLPSMREAEWATLAVFAALKKQLSPGEASDVLSQLPKDLKELWTEAQAAA